MFLVGHLSITVLRPKSITLILLNKKKKKKLLAGFVCNLRQYINYIVIGEITLREREREREINYLPTEFSYERELLGVLQVFLQTDVGAHNC
jgi:hypothetical protein